MTDEYKLNDDFKIINGSNLDVLPTIADNSIDAIVTDPPYEIGFMSRKWDNTGIAYNVELWKQAYIDYKDTIVDEDVTLVKEVMDEYGK